MKLDDCHLLSFLPTARRLLATLILTATAQVIVPQAQASPGQAGGIQQLTDMLSGEFDSRRQMNSDESANLPEPMRHGWVNRVFLTLNAPALGDHVMVGTTRYNGPPWYFDKTEFLVWSFKALPESNSIVATPRRLKNIDSYVADAMKPEKLAGITPDDLEPAISAASCAIIWQPSDNGFEGRSDQCEVMSTTQGEKLAWDWRYRLDASGMFVEFAGRDATGTAKFQTPEGAAYRLDRIASQTDIVTTPTIVRDLVTLLTGEFDSRRQAAQDAQEGVQSPAKHYWINRTFYPIDAPQLKAPSLLSTVSYNLQGDGSWLFDKGEFQIWSFAVSANGESVTMSPRRFNDAAKRQSFAYDPSRFTSLTDADLIPPSSGSKCEIVWMRSAKGFSGRSLPCNAVHTPTNRNVEWVWAYQLERDAVYIEFSGEAEDGDIVEQTPRGAPYRLDRIK